MKISEKDLCYDQIIITSNILKNDKIEIRVYDGDKDPTNVNKKRIGIYLYINKEFVDSKWIECGKIVNNILVTNPSMTKTKKTKLINEAIEQMKLKLSEIETLQKDKV